MKQAQEGRIAMDGSLYIHKSPVMVELPAGCGRYCPPVGKVPGSIYKGAVFRLMNQDRTGQADVPEGNILGRGPNIGKPRSAVVSAAVMGVPLLS